MNQNGERTPPPARSPASSRVVIHETSVGLVPSEHVEHDSTLKWIVSDGAGADAQTPPAVRMPATESPSPSPKSVTSPVPLPTSEKALAAPQTPQPWPFVVRVTAPIPAQDSSDAITPPMVRQESEIPTPPVVLDPADIPTPPPVQIVNTAPARDVLAAVSLASSPPQLKAGAPTALMREYIGAAPLDFFAEDPTPPPPTKSAPTDALGAEPAEDLPNHLHSDLELQVDAIEILPTGAEESRAAVELNAGFHPEQDKTPVDGSKTPPQEAAQALPAQPDPLPANTGILEQDTAPTAGLPAQEALAGAPLPPPPLPTVSAGTTPPPLPTLPPAALFEESETPALEEELPEALARRPLKSRSKPWFEEVFDEDYLRTLPFMTAEQTTREAGFIREALVPPSGGKILDVGCGYGRHALELAQTGLHLTGLDLSLPLLIRAADDSQRQGVAVDFIHADMRAMTFDCQFDAAYCVLSSFGYFDEETNLGVASAICKAIKPGGRFLLDILNRDYIVGDLPSRVWWEGDGCVILEEVDFNYHTSRVQIRRSVVFNDGRQREQEISIRAYSLHELGKLLRQAGFRLLEVSGGLATKSRFFGAASRNILALCERPAS